MAHSRLDTAGHTSMVLRIVHQPHLQSLKAGRNSSMLIAGDDYDLHHGYVEDLVDDVPQQWFFFPGKEELIGLTHALGAARGENNRTDGVLIHCK